MNRASSSAFDRAAPESMEAAARATPSSSVSAAPAAACCSTVSTAPSRSAALVGWTPDELLKRPAIETIAPEQRALVLRGGPGIGRLAQQLEDVAQVGERVGSIIDRQRRARVGDQLGEPGGGAFAPPRTL